LCHTSVIFLLYTSFLFLFAYCHVLLLKQGYKRIHHAPVCHDVNFDDVHMFACAWHRPVGSLSLGTFGDLVPLPIPNKPATPLNCRIPNQHALLWSAPSCSRLSMWSCRGKDCPIHHQRGSQSPPPIDLKTQTREYELTARCLIQKKQEYSICVQYQDAKSTYKIIIIVVNSFLFLVMLHLISLSL